MISNGRPGDHPGPAADPISAIALLCEDAKQ
jgi:hypothetical protein